jgi:hypothetical protein
MSDAGDLVTEPVCLPVSVPLEAKSPEGNREAGARILAVQEKVRASAAKKAKPMGFLMKLFIGNWAVMSAELVLLMTLSKQ